MAKHSPGKWRLEVVFGLLVLAVGGLGYRVYDLIRSTGDRAERMVERQQMMTRPEAGRPGGIYMRAGKMLVPVAESRQTPSIYVDPNRLDDKDLPAACALLGKALSMDPNRVRQEIMERRDRRFAWIRREVTPLEANAVKALHMPWAGIEYEWRRDYPAGPTAAAVVGWRPAEANTSSGAGSELRHKKVIEPRDGVRVEVADVSRRPVMLLADMSRPPEDGCSVVLCIDASIQGFLEEALAESVGKYQGKWGAGIVVNPQTGEILAMACVPSFNPNEFAQTDPNWLTNRAITMPYEPGSVAKPIFAAAAVEARAVTYDTMIFCENGTYFASKGGRISDHGNHYETMSVRDIVVHSSNIGMAKIGEKLGNRQLRQVALRFGLGQPTGVELPGEGKGILRPWTRPNGQPLWDGYSLRRVPFGQEVSATTLQLAMAFSALVNGGELLRPRIADRVVDANGQVVKEFPRTAVRRVISPAVSEQTISVMADVVERGTGSKCKSARWTTLGKTGTAQIARNGVYVDHAYVASFVGAGPVHSPKALCLISVYWPNSSKGYYGGTVAAPYVKDVLEKTLAYMGVPPDRAVASAGGN
jgi:cell division protein FtsI/penicillin-binding protein 2